MSNYIGDVVYIAKNALPATNDDTGFEALSWVKVAGVQTNPKFGLTHSIIEVEDLESGWTKGEKGAGQGTETEMAFRTIAGDTGQADALEVSEDAEGLCSVKVVRKASGTGGTVAPGDTVEYAQGIMHSYVPTDRNVSSFEGFTVSFRQNEPTVFSVEPTP